MNLLHPLCCGLAVLLSVTALTAQEIPEAVDPAPTAEPSDATPLLERPKIRLRVDPSGMIIIEGPSNEVSNFNFVYEEIVDKLKSMQTPLPDIRKYKCKHIDVTLAASILDSVYNGPTKARAAQAASDRRRNPRSDARDRGKEEEEPEPEERSVPPGLSGLSSLFSGDSASKTPADLMGIQVVPDKRSGYLFIMAKSELFPMIIETLHTIDTEAVIERDYEIVVLKKLNADEVTAALEDLLGITEAEEARKASLQRAARSRSNRQGNQQPNQLANQLEDELVQIGGAEGFSIKDIRISALAATNSIIVFGPMEARDSIVQIINKLDEQGNETRVMTKALENADADSLAKTLQAAYGAKDNSSVVNITADPATNTIFISAPPSLREEVMIAIAQAEGQARERKPRAIQVTLGDAKAIAETLKESFKDANKGKNKVTIAADSTSNQILVSAPDDRFNEIEALVHQMDSSGAPVLPKFYRLEHAYAPDVKDQVLEMAKQLALSSGDPKSVGPFGVTADRATNSLVVMGTQKSFLIMDQVIAQVDVPPKDPTRRSTRTIPLYKNDAKEVAANINKLYMGKKTEGVDPPVADPNLSTNAVIVAGTLKQIGEIEEFITSLEAIASPGEGELGSYTIDLQFVDAQQAAEMINQVFQQLFQARKGVGTKMNDAEMTVTVTPDTMANRLFVNATERNKQKIDEIVSAIDNLEAGGVKTRTTEIFRLKFADPGNVATIINDRFKTRRGVAESEQVSAQVDMGTQSVVVTASGQNMGIVREVLQQLDVEGSQGRITEVIKLTKARAADVAEIIGRRENEIRHRTRQGQLPSSVVANEFTNSLLVTASPQDFEELKSLITELDATPSVDKARFIKPYRIRYANLWSVRDSIDQAFNSGRGIKEEDRVNAGIDWDTGNLIVTANSERHAEIEAMLAQIDKESDSARTVHVIKLGHGDAASVGNNVQQMINQRRTQRGQTNPGVTSDVATNSLFIYASEKEMAEFRPVIDSMDIEDQLSGTPQRIVLQHKNASEVADLLTKVFTEPAQQAGGGRGAPQRMVPTIVADDAGNALVVRAQELDYNEIAKMVASIDTEDEDGASNVRIIQVTEGVDVESLSRTIEDVIRQGEEFNARANRNYKPRLVSVGYDARTSTLLVSGSKSQFDQVEELVHKLESIQPAGKQNIRVINFKNIRSADVKKVLDQMLEDRSQSQRRGRR